jgi:uncharacterized membrane protein YjgN (DUF898 family)
MRRCNPWTLSRIEEESMISYWQLCTSYVGSRYGWTDRKTSAVECVILVALIAIAGVAAIAFLHHGGSAHIVSGTPA